MYGAYLPRRPRACSSSGRALCRSVRPASSTTPGRRRSRRCEEEGIATVLVNPNIATVQTSEALADRIYFVAVTPEFVERIIVKEEVDAILLSFGGQTALNCGLAARTTRACSSATACACSARRSSHDPRHRGPGALRRAPGRDRRQDRAQPGLPVPPPRRARRRSQIGLPGHAARAAIRSAARAAASSTTEAELDAAVKRAFAGGMQQVLVEECLRGWKEIEYEVVRDGRDNCITVCNMENLDPMGIHTGESIVVAPSQTLNDEEYQLLRTIAIKTIRHLGIVGECNIQYALDPRSTRLPRHRGQRAAVALERAGEQGDRLSARLRRGQDRARLRRCRRSRTASRGARPPSSSRRSTTSSARFPRWDLAKFRGASTRIGSEMKSVGEVMAIGRTFPEVIQKALRMLDIGVRGLDPDAYAFDDVRDELRECRRRCASSPSRGRCATVCRSTRSTRSPGIDRWFLDADRDRSSTMHQRADERQRNAARRRALRGTPSSSGFSRSRHRSRSPTCTVQRVREQRNAATGIEPHLAQIDTLAAEFPAETNYLYTTLPRASQSDVAPSWRKKIMVLGSGAYRIGSSVEFDWCCVNAVEAAAGARRTRPSWSTTTRRPSAPTTTCATAGLRRDQPRDGRSISTSASSPTASSSAWAARSRTTSRCGLHRAGVKILGTSAGEHRSGRGPQQVQRAARRARHRPAAVGSRDRCHGRRLASSSGSAASRCWCARATSLSGAAMSVAHEPNELRRDPGARARACRPSTRS